MKYKKILLLAVAMILAFGNSACASTNKNLTRIDEVPLYGGMDRQADKRFREGDEKFIKSVSKKWGSREAAAKAWVDQGFAFYFRDDLGMAMRRFNQAWLLDPNNPEVYHGLASVLYDKDDVCGSMEMFEKGLTLKWTASNESGFLADAAKAMSYCAVQRKNQGHDGYAELIKKSDETFLRAEELFKARRDLANGYLYSNWWMALYTRGEYAEAWKKVFLMREEGGEMRGNYVQGLKAAMPEPSK
ncbi:MAG: hypothetical protein KBD53_06280 [Candidatus Omnitrophica bacterium]|nr:hypothetical protein [Candidatus Omnitrophota bacterium]